MGDQKTCCENLFHLAIFIISYYTVGGVLGTNRTLNRGNCRRLNKAVIKKGEVLLKESNSFSSFIFSSGPNKEGF